MSATEFQQKEGGIMIYPGADKPWLKLIFKGPVHLWRLGLGPLIGKIFMLITHTGRKSGLPRRTMTEYHTLNGQHYVPCAFGEKAQWYKNIKADPLVTIQTAEGARAMQARRVVDDEELIAVYEFMKAHNPVHIGPYLKSLDIEPTHEDILAKKDRIYFLTFDPTDAPTPPPLEADLVWVWGVVAFMIVWLLAFGRGRRD